MQKISPLRASVTNALEKFKTQRTNNNAENNSASTNPFGITFKGVLLQSDVFESSAKEKAPQASMSEKIDSSKKILASAWVGTINKFNSMKTSTIAFGNRIKEATQNTINMLNTTNVDFDFFKNTVSRLEKRPVNELETMLRAEIGEVA